MSFLWRCRHSLIRARPRRIPLGTRGVTGQFDHLPLPLPYKIEDGLRDFLPPPALEAVAMDYQLGLLARLTEEVRDTEDEDSSVTQVVISTAPYREKTLAFNYASLALNNSFFLSNLTPNAEDADEGAISPTLMTQIRTEHGGFENFKSTISASAMGMFTSGYVWFVCDRAGSTFVLPTFGPGTLLVRSRTYMSHAHPDLYHHDVPTTPAAWDREMKYMDKYLKDWNVDLPPILDPAELGAFLDQEPPEPKPSATAPPARSPSRAAGPSPLQPRFFHSSAVRASDSNADADADADADTDVVDDELREYDYGHEEAEPEPSQSTFDAAPTSLYHGTARRSAPRSKVDALHQGEVLYPLFCVAVQEHAWVSAGYGVWGKEAWLREFWSVLNWRRVSEAYNKVREASR
ncbi:manganese superoxide dismutase [Mycena belliarum]|uniref:Manganese superoxide dismutase n=1 Tax=Mycena belliarum TaxID=1033014 RepID=A0AAD6XRB9_9AGAR|nr:manganese superoxide dismutase [Mycena belliae]